MNLTAEIIEVLKFKTPISSFDAVSSIWRKLEYDKLKNALSHSGISFELILKTNYKDKIKFFSNENELDIELDYGGDGMVNIITAKFYSSVSIWEDFQKAIEQIKQ